MIRDEMRREERKKQKPFNLTEPIAECRLGNSFN